MDFDFLRLLAWYVGVFVVVGAIDTLLAALAYRINLGAAELPMDQREFWTRSALVGFLVAAYKAVAVFVALVLVSRTSYTLFWILMAPYPVLAVLLCNWAYALDDLLEAFKIFLLQHFLPALVLIVCFLFVFSVAGFLRFVAPSL